MGGGGALSSSTGALDARELATGWGVVGPTARLAWRRQGQPQSAERAVESEKEAATDLAKVLGEAIAAQAKADALVAKIKASHLLASAAKEKAQHARALAQETEHKAATKSNALQLLALAAKEEAQHARARAQEAEKEAAEYKDVAERAHNWADGLWQRCRAALGNERIHVLGPPMFPIF